MLFDCKSYYSFFQPLEVTRHTLLSDKMGFHFFELPKLPDDISQENMLMLWLALFKADTEEEPEKIKGMEAPIMSQAINAYYTITASSEFREKEQLRTRVCLKIHSCHLHAPLYGRFVPHSVNVAQYASLIRDKSPANCDAQLTESNFKTHSSTRY